MGHPEHDKLNEGLAISARYISHLESEVKDMRRLRDEMRTEIAALRADLWGRGMQCAQYKARADAERANAELLFGMLVEAEKPA
jgi:hypothetical protein